MTPRLGLIVTLASLTAWPALAQQRPRPATPPRSQPAARPLLPRGVASINGGWQAPAREFDDTLSFDQYLEKATTDAGYTVDAAPLYEGGLGVRVWRALGVGMSFSKFSDKSPAQVSGSIPHPFFFSRPRSIEGEVTGITRDETTINAQALAFVRAGSRVLVVVSGGPSLVTVRQRLVTRVHWDESYPYDTATFRTADTQSNSESKVGFNAGADIIFRFGRSFGIGALVRYTQAKVEFSPADGRTVAVDAGGAQAGAGIRLIF